jgi:hypothetical protein
MRVRAPPAAPRDRRRQAGAGPEYELVFTDRLLLTLVHLRTGLTHETFGVIYQVGSSTIGRAIGEIRPLLAKTRVRRPATTRPAPAHPGRRVRLRRGRNRHTASTAPGTSCTAPGSPTTVMSASPGGNAYGRACGASAYFE